MTSLQASPDGQFLEFGDFRIDMARRRLMRADGAPVTLRPRVFDLLAFLVAHPGEILDKQTLIDAVWVDLIVDENNLNQTVSALRRALGETREDPKIILTVPRRGYQFVAPVRSVGADAVREAVSSGSRPASAGDFAASFARVLSSWRLAALAAIGAAGALTGVLVTRDHLIPARAIPISSLSIAVLPFTSLSDDPEHEYFAYGLSVELINELARIDGLHVIRHTSSFAVEDRGLDVSETGEMLGVAYILEGEARKGDEDDIRVTARLVSTADGALVWSAGYDSSADDVIAIAGDVAAQLSPALNVGDDRFITPSQSDEAYDLYLSALGLLSANGRGNVLMAEARLREALEIDSRFVAARLGLVDVLWSVAAFADERTVETMAEIDAITTSLIAESPVSWLGHGLRAERAMADADWLDAEWSLAAAHESMPPGRHERIVHAEIGLLMRVGRIEEGLDLILADAGDDPLALEDSVIKQIALTIAERDDAAEDEYDRSRTLLGDRSSAALTALARAIGRGDSALIEERLLDYLETDFGRPGDAELFAVRHDRDAALNVLREQIGRARTGEVVGTMNPALAAMWADHYGDVELALDGVSIWLDVPEAAWAIWFPALKNARRLAGFKDLMREFGFWDYWRETGNWSDYCRPLGDDDFECF